ncbi:uncharacterized protein AKAW2_60332A [Aspergillus luchuensis]|uniref:Uncharacterized protein n=2 Tax=Aspergillus kawachii TaxID=1069201 RepID=A0A7R7X2W0_ASPKA|nr:uncharacterized protein AKAW2_60332A [Aspergillus luchuensis]BCS02068.1 hypothetical protein AKAW2_60332A [Aspergillus luchuensis]BCS13753.1 hypothetical protein ALUC_60309A [Aspergillus luchuensis]GAA90348.1 hypothetical protein AKAW_08462 [Aspergillus luchuensis IFO 4308]
MHLSTLFLTFLSLSPTLSQPTSPISVTQLFNFSTSTDIENGAIDPVTNTMLITTFTDARLYALDLNDPYPTANLLTSFYPNATAITGIAPIGHGKYAITGGVRGSYHYYNETIYTIDFGAFAANITASPVTKAVAHLPQAIMLNGLASLPRRPTTVLAADSRVGCIFRIDTLTGTSDIVVQSDALSAPANGSSEIGINGLKTHGEYAYYTNTALKTFGRVKITDDGIAVPGKNGKVEAEVLATLDSGLERYQWDDFDFDGEGTVYVAMGGPNGSAIGTISPDGDVEVLFTKVVRGPTSVHVVEKEGMRKKLYITTNSGGGQVVEAVL